MRTPDEWRDFAAECLRQAGRARTVRHQVFLLRMAQTWIDVADEAGRGAPGLPQTSGGGDAVQEAVDGALQGLRLG
jgi:hypothetical protein